jgi:hypothetical protein
MPFDGTNGPFREPRWDRRPGSSRVQRALRGWGPIEHGERARRCMEGGCVPARPRNVVRVALHLGENPEGAPRRWLIGRFVVPFSSRRRHPPNRLSAP